MGYVIFHTDPTNGRVSYCRPKDGILHMTAKRLGDEYPSLVRVYSTKASARAALRRLVSRYSCDRFGDIVNYRVAAV